MSSSIGIILAVTLGLIAAAMMRARANAKLKPVFDMAARKHKAKIHRSFLGMPQLIKHVDHHSIRMTPMSISTSSSEGGGEMTCVDFDLPGFDACEFRIREKSDARRNALPTALMGENKSFALGIPQIDARFSVVGTDVEKTVRILTETSVSESIIALPGGADIHVRGGRGYVSVKGLPHSVDFVDRLFETSELLLASVQNTSR
jgi:hypothetical protein